MPNPVGTAPGIWMQVDRATIACLPGVPHEMKLMFRDQVVPRLREKGLISLVTVHQKINLFGKGESEIEAQAMDLTARGRVPEVGITAHDSTISFRITATAGTEAEARHRIEPTVKLIYERFGSLVVGVGSDDVPEAVAAQLAAANATLATAESCTGGVIAEMITAIAGCQSLLSWWRRQLRQPSQDRPPGRPASADRKPRRGQSRSGRRDGRRGANALGCRSGPRDHGSRRSLGRISGKAGRSGLPRTGDIERNTDAPARHRLGSAARHHPAPFVEGRAQLGQADAAGEAVEIGAKRSRTAEAGRAPKGNVEPPHAVNTLLTFPALSSRHLSLLSCPSFPSFPFVQGWSQLEQKDAKETKKWRKKLRRSPEFRRARGGLSPVRRSILAASATTLAP